MIKQTKMYNFYKVYQGVFPKSDHGMVSVPVAKCLKKKQYLSISEDCH